jgi:DNA-binding GntR family transcriptional regulator
VTAPTVRAELAAAVRRLNVAFHKLPKEARPNITWRDIDDTLEALASGDRERALAAIDDWERHHRELFREAVA